MGKHEGRGSTPCVQRAQACTGRLCVCVCVCVCVCARDGCVQEHKEKAVRRCVCVCMCVCACTHACTALSEVAEHGREEGARRAACGLCLWGPGSTAALPRPSPLIHKDTRTHSAHADRHTRTPAPPAAAAAAGCAPPPADWTCVREGREGEGREAARVSKSTRQHECVCVCACVHVCVCVCVCVCRL